jgi:putative nucleotidyltransferase with HDIG domain/PAS domain S-box-containing protein
MGLSKATATGVRMTLSPDECQANLARANHHQEFLPPEEMWRRYEFIANTSHDFMTLINADYVYEAANRAYCAAHCKLPQEIIGRHVADVWGREIFDTVVKRALDTCFAGQEIGYQSWFEFSTLGMRYMDVAYYPYRDSGGAVTHAVVVSRDVTAFKLAQDEAQRQVHRLAAIHNLDSAIITSLDIPNILTVLLEQATEQLGLDAADVLLYDATFQTLQFAAGTGFAASPATRRSVRLGEGLAGRAASTGDIVSATFDAGDISEDLAQPAWETEERVAAYYGVPLLARGQLRGVLELYSYRQPVVDAEWLRFLGTLGGQAAIALENAQLVQDLQSANLELIAAYDATLEGWVRTLDMRDRETEGHTQRVAAMAVALARAMGIEEATLVHVRRGALLHDIGKMAIPDSILLKPGPLTAEELHLMRKHPEYAYELLSRFAFLRPALDIPYCHHEKWDGTGYPRGLRGEEIPLIARIFSVVDVWDALRSNRPYRSALPETEACRIVSQQSGAHFDPAVVEVFLKSRAEVTDR